MELIQRTKKFHIFWTISHQNGHCETSNNINIYFFPRSTLFSLLAKMTRQIFTNFIILIVFANLVFGFELGQLVDSHEINHDVVENKTVNEKGKKSISKHYFQCKQYLTYKVPKPSINFLEQLHYQYFINQSIFQLEPVCVRNSKKSS